MEIKIRNPRAVTTTGIILMVLASWLIFLDGIIGKVVFSTTCWLDPVCSAAPGIFVGIAFFIMGIIGVQAGSSQLGPGCHRCHMICYLIFTILGIITCFLFFIAVSLVIEANPDPPEIEKIGLAFAQGLTMIRIVEFGIVAVVTVTCFVASIFACCNVCCNKQDVEITERYVSPATARNITVTTHTMPLNSPGSAPDSRIVNVGGYPVEMPMENQPQITPHYTAVYGQSGSTPPEQSGRQDHTV